jgi:hypothetical protein
MDQDRPKPHFIKERWSGIRCGSRQRGGRWQFLLCHEPAEENAFIHCIHSIKSIYSQRYRLLITTHTPNILGDEGAQLERLSIDNTKPSMDRLRKQ